MKVETRNCEDCQHRRWVGDHGLRCTKGHKQRFYNPRRGELYAEGWRRRCADYVLGDHVMLIGGKEGAST